MSCVEFLTRQGILKTIDDYLEIFSLFLQEVW